eukprot:11208256-Lingulodinium_polyedra.AAC.1
MAQTGQGHLGRRRLCPSLRKTRQTSPPAAAAASSARPSCCSRPRAVTTATHRRPRQRQNKRLATGNQER